MPRVLVPLAEGCEELEAVTIIDLLRRAEIEVVTAGLSIGPIKASRDVTIVPDTMLDKALEDDYDLIVLPGGAGGAKALEACQPIIERIRAMVRDAKPVAAICAGPRVLAAAGVLDGKKATAYPGFIDQGDFPDVTYTGSPLEVDGRIITSRGPGTAMDFALKLIEVLKDTGTRDTVEKALLRP